MFTIVGVMPADFRFVSNEVQLWTPAAFTPADRADDRRHSNSWQMLARLKPGIGMATAQQQIDALNARNLERFPHFREMLTNAGFHTYVIGLHDDLVAETRATLWLLWAFAGFVLLIGALNVANLVSVRATAQIRELVTRLALGATLGSLTRQILTEALVLTDGRRRARACCSAGGRCGRRRCSASTPCRAAPRSASTRRWRSTRSPWWPLVGDARRRRAGDAAAGRRRGRRHPRRGPLGHGLASHAAAASRAGRRARWPSRWCCWSAPDCCWPASIACWPSTPASGAEGVLTGQISLPTARYPDDAALRSAYDRLLPALRAIPGAAAVGLTSSLPFGGDYSDSVILAEGYQMAPGRVADLAVADRVSDGPGRRARDVARRRTHVHAPPTAPARRGRSSSTSGWPQHFWPGQSPLGRRMYFPSDPNDLLKPPADDQWLTVVGVVAQCAAARRWPTAATRGSSVPTTSRWRSRPIAACRS